MYQTSKRALQPAARVASRGRRPMLCSRTFSSSERSDVNVIKEIQENSEKLTEWRRDFHMHPEIGFEEFRTSELVASRLHAMGIEQNQ